MNVVVIEDKRYVLIPEKEYLDGTSKLKDTARKVINTLSCSELDSARYLFEVLEDTDMITSAQIADKVGITRPVVTSLLKKLRASGVLKVYNMGRKGSKVEILNSVFVAMLRKM